jgi:DNA ligase (NAD+)
MAEATAVSHLEKLEGEYLQAKQAYYNGAPIMTDAEFDELEDQLVALNSTVTTKVGAVGSYDRKHPSPMLSLSKIMVMEDDKLPIEQFEKWASKVPGPTQFEYTPKLDGSSCNLVYINGQLDSAITRGDGIHGTDITAKMRMIVPHSISCTDRVEIRGEVVIRSDIFALKYQKDYKNPRNFVASVLGRKEDFDEAKDFTFIAFEARIHKDGEIQYVKIESVDGNGNVGSSNFNLPYSFIATANEFDKAYRTMLSHRIDSSLFQLDGFVVKYPYIHRADLGENDHDPNWAVAIKFPPKEAITDVIGLEWNVGSTSELCPVAVLRPVFLDGTEVSRVSVYNYGNVSKLGLYPGARVAIAKSGDIIPIVKRVITPSTNGSAPARCTCGSVTEIDGIHVYCTGDTCGDRDLVKIRRGLTLLGVKNFGDSTVERLMQAGIKRIQDYFDASKFNKLALINSGLFKPGRSLDIIFDSFNERKPLTLDLAIVILQFDGVGRTISKAIAQHMVGGTPDFSGMTKEVLARMLSPISEESRAVRAFLTLLSDNGHKVENPKKVSADAIKIEMTGSPKPHWNTKDALMAELAAKNVIHHGLKPDTTYLVTDDKNSTSSKMAKAAKLGVKVITYAELKSIIA